MHRHIRYDNRQIQHEVTQQTNSVLLHLGFRFLGLLGFLGFRGFRGFGV